MHFPDGRLRCLRFRLVDRFNHPIHRWETIEHDAGDHTKKLLKLLDSQRKHTRRTRDIFIADVPLLLAGRDILRDRCVLSAARK